MTRRGFFGFLGGLFAWMLSPFKAVAPPVVQNTRRAVFLGAEAAKLCYGEFNGVLLMESPWVRCTNPTSRVTTEDGELVWEEPC